MTRLLLDSHALFWFVEGDSRLSAGACEAIRDPANAVYVSAVTAWEIANKFRLGKWPGAQELANDLVSIMSDLSFEPLPISLAHARHAGVLHSEHRDPFDRMLAAQAEIEDIPLVTADPAFRNFNVRILW
jgi:PIN domain nuclease of toxin-antitoxin system